MSEVGVVFREFEFSHEGKTWKLGRPTLSVERAYASSREKAEIRTIERNRGEMSRDSYAILLESWLGAAANNKYGWNSPAFVGSLGDVENVIHLLWCWIGEYFNEARALAGKCDRSLILTEDAIRKIFHASTESREALLKLIGDAMADPNPLPPSAN
jgi:hypothetical protein